MSYTVGDNLLDLLMFRSLWQVGTSQQIDRFWRERCVQCFYQQLEPETRMCFGRRPCNGYFSCESPVGLFAVFMVDNEDGQGSFFVFLEETIWLLLHIGYHKKGQSALFVEV